jgi:hypothetical protein
LSTQSSPLKKEPHRKAAQLATVAEARVAVALEEHKTNVQTHLLQRAATAALGGDEHGGFVVSGVVMA